jgi:hypothetical protein
LDYILVLLDAGFAPLELLQHPLLSICIGFDVSLRGSQIGMASKYLKIAQ